jgi:hypothetical protein
MHRRARALIAVIVTAGFGLLIASCWPDSYSLRPIAESSSTAQLATGCWRFELGADVFEERVPSGAAVRLEPAGVPITNGKLSTDVRRLRIVPLDSATRRWVGVSGWGIDSIDDRLVHLWIGDGFTGFSFRLRLRDGAFAGTVRAYSDVGPDLALRHRVRAVRVGCAVTSLTTGLSAQAA